MKARQVNIYMVAGYAFIEHPAARGLWLRCHPCVTVTCPHCYAKPGEPCRGKSGTIWSGTHYDRRNAKHRENTSG